MTAWDDLTEDQLLAELRAAVAEADLVTDRQREAARAAFTWRTVAPGCTRTRAPPGSGWMRRKAVRVSSTDCSRACCRRASASRVSARAMASSARCRPPVRSGICTRAPTVQLRRKSPVGKAPDGYATSP